MPWRKTDVQKISDEDFVAALVKISAMHDALTTTIADLVEAIATNSESIATNGVNEDGSKNVRLTGSKAEQSSAQYTKTATTVEEYTLAEGASQIELYVETGYVRVRTDGEPCTSTTGEPIAAGFGAAWTVDSISVFYIQESVVTVVSR